MSDRGEFERADYGIPVDGGSIAEGLKQTLRTRWKASSRQDISCIREAPEFDGVVGAVDMVEGAELPMFSGHLETLLQDGWGLLHYDSSSLYLSKIQYDSLTHEYYYAGREEKGTPNDLAFVQVDTPNIEDKCCWQLWSDLTEYWSPSCLKEVNTIQSRGDDSFVVMTDDHSIVEEDGLAFDVVYSYEPSVPTVESIDSLLTSGWAVYGVTSNMLYISSLQTVLSETTAFAVEDHRSSSTCTPEPCEECGEYESEETFVSGETTDSNADIQVPEYTALCLDCFQAKGDTVVTIDEYHNRQESNI
jgi:hypothetical protein